MSVDNGMLDNIFEENVTNIDIDAFIEACDAKGIPIFICLLKTIKIMSKTLEKEDICSIIMSYSRFSSIIKEVETGILIDTYKEYTLDDDVIVPKTLKASNINKIVMVNKDEIHSTFHPEPEFSVYSGKGYPPSLEAYQCLHTNCKKRFDSINGLVQHLKKKECYVQGWHYRHITWYSGYNGDRIIRERLTKCSVCKFIGLVPTDLIDHLCVLGIRNFCDSKASYWETREILTKKDEIKAEVSVNKIYTEDECIICYDSKPQTILFPCMHNTFCVKCISNKNICPMCGTEIVNMVIF